MSETTPAQRVPQWDVADRMRKALREADVGVQEMAEYLGVGRSTVSTWINGRIAPGKQTMRLWALRCGVSYEWLATGELFADKPLTRDDGGAASRCTRPPRELSRLRIVPPAVVSASMRHTLDRTA